MRAALLVLPLLLAACARPDQEAGGGGGLPGMAGMPGMEGMAMGSDTGGVPLDRARAAQLGITFARAADRPVRAELRLVGYLAWAEPRREYVNARVDGWVETLYADYVGRPVAKGEALLALYAPELVSIQEEYLAARRMGDSVLQAAARRRLHLWNIPEDQIEAIASTGEVRRTILLRAPRDGEIVEKMVIQGQAVRSGDNLFLIADRRRLWADLAVFEMDAPAVQVGTPVRLTADALPGRSYAGRVTFLSPSVDEKSRTLTARVEVENRDGALRPGMFATAYVSPAALHRLSVPREAVLPTGTRNLVFVNRGDGRFVPREVTVGARGDSLIEILAGLKPGDEVVASATYLLDSESNLAAAMQGLMLQMGMGLDMGGMRMEAGDRTGPPERRTAGQGAPR